MKEKQIKWTARFCLLAAALGLLAAVVLIPRQGVNLVETELLWDGKLRESMELIQQGGQDGFYLVQRQGRQYLALRGYDGAYSAPEWKVEEGTLTLSAQFHPGKGTGIQLYRIYLKGYDTILTEENGESTAIQSVIVR